MDYPGWWNDGCSAERHPVRVRLMGRRLLVTGAEADRPLAELPLDGLALAEEIYAGQPLRLKHDGWPDARLTVDDHALMGKLIAAAPRLARRYHAQRSTLYRFTAWTGALVAVLALLLGVVQFGAEPLAALVPLEWEDALGTELMAGFIDEYGLCEANPGLGHVQDLVDELAAQAESPYRFRVHVLQGEEVNAFALPGGRIGVFDGLVKAADGPGELAGVLAHEVAHGIERHATEQIIRRSGYSLIASLVTGDLSGFAALAGDTAAFMASMANSRADEAEADRLAMRLLNAAGIDSAGLPRFFERLEESGRSLPDPLMLASTHPANAARIAETRSMVREGRAPLGDAEWQAVRQICGGVSGTISGSASRSSGSEQD